LFRNKRADCKQKYKSLSKGGDANLKKYKKFKQNFAF
jgi:hypothetical protein